jgi:hypothetical protein
MPVLDWIGKKAVVNHHREVPYRFIHCDKEKSVALCQSRRPSRSKLLCRGHAGYPFCRDASWRSDAARRIVPDARKFTNGK